MTEEGAPTRGRKPRDPSLTIKRIIDAARVEFGAKGFDGAKVEHIARRAKVSKQLVYLYFDGKKDLYRELAKDISRKAYGRLLAVDFAALEPVAAIRTYIETIYDLFLDDPVIGVVTIDQSLHAGEHVSMPTEILRMQEQLRGRIGEAIERARSAGLFGDHVDTLALEFMTTIIVSGCVSSRTMFERFAGQKSDENPLFWRDYATDFILRALRA